VGFLRVSDSTFVCMRTACFSHPILFDFITLGIFGEGFCFFARVWGSHSNCCEEFYLLEYNVISQSTFRRSIRPQ
jgi:hypothetical protein